VGREKNEWSFRTGPINSAPYATLALQVKPYNLGRQTRPPTANRRAVGSGTPGAVYALFSTTRPHDAGRGMLVDTGRALLGRGWRPSYEISLHGNSTNS